MRGLGDVRPEPVVAGMAPKLAVMSNGSTDVNLQRAERSGSVAIPKPRRRRRARAGRADEFRISTIEQLPRRLRTMTRLKQPPEVDFSAFVQLEQDLDPDARKRLRLRLEELARRVNLKLDTASAEIPAAALDTLRRTPGVAYVEPGQTLRAPEPLVGAATSRTPPDERRITTAARRHRYGQDVLVGIIDVGGFDFAHGDFRTGPDHERTRWVSIWDQGGVGRPSPQARGGRFTSLDYGAEVLQAHMDAAIAAASARGVAATRLEPQSQISPDSHGTHVASIAAGNRGIARRAHLAGVLIALTKEDLDPRSSFYDSTRIADAIEYLLGVAADLGGETPLPVSINISLGTNGHAHDTSSAIARWIDYALSAPGRCVTVAAGNAGQVEAATPDDEGFVMGRVHAAGKFAATNLRHELSWIVVGNQIVDVSENEMEIWYSAQDRMDVEIRPPGGEWIGPIHPGQEIKNTRLPNGTVLSVISETYYPANGANRIGIYLSPYYAGDDGSGQRIVVGIAAGEWRVRLSGLVVRDGRYDAWIERDDPQRLGVLGDKDAWAFPSFFGRGSYVDSGTISSLGCGERILAVANIDVRQGTAHATSSRGPTRDGRHKPDVGADGTDVVAAAGFNQAEPWVAMTGTSMASPYVCGVTALMLGVEPTLTAAQILGIIRRTSSPLPGHDFTWRTDTGFGLIDAAACLEETVAFASSRVDGP